MAKKRDYWNRKALFDTGGDYLIVFGQNCSGKSYQGKEECFERIKKGERFFYLRRWQTDLNQNIAPSYFDDMDVNKLTGGDWDDIIARSGMYYLCRTDDDGKREYDDEPCGYYGDLNEWQRYKSNVYLNCTFILFEEFITDGVYLDDEPLKLQRLVTTVFRDHKGQVMMVGNTVSRIVPYIQEWIPNAVNQKQGTIELYHMHDAVGEGNDVLIAVEYGGRIKGSGSMFFGEASKSIMAGEWSVDDRPKLPRDHIDYEKVYEMVLEYQNFSFMLELLVDPEEGTKILFVYPKTTDRKVERKITDRFTTKMFESRYFRDNVPENYIRQCIESNMVCYSDNLTASDFNGVIAQMDL